MNLSNLPGPCSCLIHYVLTLLEKMSQQFSECNCLVPCIRVRYEPNLSYAQLSRINVDRLIIDTQKERDQLQVWLKQLFCNGGGFLSVKECFQ